MILVFKFFYVSNNRVLPKFIDFIAKNSALEYYITKDNSTFALHVRAEEKAVLEFAQLLSNSLPLSIFLKSIDVKAVDEFDIDKAISIKECEIFTSFSKSAQLKADESFDPFIENEVGLNPKVSKSLVITKKDEKKVKIYKDRYKDAFVEISKLLLNKEKVQLKTPYVSNQACIITPELAFEDDFIVMPTDLSLINTLVVITKNEVSTLASLEKPTINLKTTLIFKNRYKNIPDFINIKMPDTLFLYLLCKSLHEKSVDFLVLTNNKEANNLVEIEGTKIESQELNVTVLENGEVLILKGDRYLSAEEKNKIKYLSHASHTQYISLLQEYNLFEKNICCFYLSHKNNDKLMFYSDKSGILDIIDINFEDNIAEIFNAIKKDEIGDKLLNNYKNEFSDIYEIANSTKVYKNHRNIATLCGILAVILGFSNNVEDGSRKIIEKIRSFGGLKGPRVDYILNDDKNLKTSLNHYKLIRSVISYKLAGVDDETISFGVMESLVYFLSDSADSFRDSLKTEIVMLGGSLFGMSIFSSLCVKHIGVNHKVLFNKELQIELVEDETVHRI